MNFPIVNADAFGIPKQIFDINPRFEYENEQILAETDSMNSCVYRSALFRFVDRPL
ncbi:hypothetical protein [Burkholderia ubonensis]|uniref:hypothetical protein n=1 Tax=Burkholderia ubonensis TaxID=101571 RepID=UPI000A7D90EB|nr:hypothetical protein [Burkholderia ubonensis]MDY7790535.1 hypothetical protein [Burkholderia ubonensis]